MSHPGPIFAWDQRKDAENKRKHHVSFNEAKTVFFDESARLIDDPDHSDDEERFVIIGFSSALRVLLVCHCYRQDDDVIRIISARKADKHEAGQYQGGL